MPVPKRKVSKSRRDKRSANKGIKPKSLSACSNCAAPIVGHHMCEGCGFYKGRKIMTTKTERAVVRAQKRAAAQKKNPSTSDSDRA